MLAALGLVHPVAQPLHQGPSLFHPQAQPLIVSEWLQQLQTSHAHIPLLKSLMRSLPFLFLTSKKKNFPEASQQTSHVSPVRIVSYLSHSVSGIWEWLGRTFLVWYLVRLGSSEGWIGVEGSDS